MIAAGVASNRRRAAQLLDVDSISEEKNHKVELPMRIRNFLRKLAYAILDTGPGPKHSKLEYMDTARKVAISDGKPFEIRFTAKTPLRVIGKFWFATNIEQQVSDTGFLVVKTLGVDMLLRTAYINAFVK